MITRFRYHHVVRSFPIVALVLAITACSGGGASGTDAAIDAFVPGPCWPEATTPHGSVVLGTGYSAFEPMPENLVLEYGVQDGYNFVANVRMTGFDPGNPNDVLDPKNPRTRIRAFFEEGNVPLNFYASCPVRLSYVASGGEYVMQTGVPIIFETCWRSDNLIGKRIRIDLELADSQGRIATDSKIVTAAPPTTDYPMETGSPGCVH